jgi:hypothetical protein
MHIKSAIVSLVVGLVIALVIIMPAQSLVTSLEWQPELQGNYKGYRSDPDSWSAREIKRSREDMTEHYATMISYCEAKILTLEGEVRDGEAAVRDAQESDPYTLVKKQVLANARASLEQERMSLGSYAADLATVRAAEAQETLKVAKDQAAERELDSKIQTAKDRLFAAKESYSDRLMYGVLAGVGGALLMFVLLVKVIGAGK